MFIEYLDCFNSDVWRSIGYGKCGVGKKEFSELSKKYSLFQKVTSRSLPIPYVHLMSTNKRKNTHINFVSA